MAYWIFKCNPDKYRLEDRLENLNPLLTWTVSRHRDEIGPGDTVFLWVTGPNRGIRAIMRVDAAPRLMTELESEQLYWTDRETKERWKVVGTLTHRNLNISHKSLRETKGLENLSVFHGFQQLTNYPVSHDEGVILMRMVGGGRAL